MASRKPSQKKRAYGTQLKPQKGENPENRPFLGREKKLSKQTQLSALLTATLDILARFRATQEPIQKNAKIHPKIFKNLSKRCPQKQLGSKLAQECALENKLTRFLSPLGRFWAPFCAQLGAKGSQNLPF